MFVAHPACGRWAVGPVVRKRQRANSLPHWAFQPVFRPDPASVQHGKWTGNPIDQFMVVVLKAISLKPAAPATREQLIRCVTFGFIGRPPLLNEIDAFLADLVPKGV